VGTVIVVGETEICGANGLLVRISAVRELEVAEPGFGFVTVICTLPACEAVAVPVAVSCVAETKLVASGVPPKFTTAPLTNDEPERAIENEPSASCAGERVESRGMGFSTSALAEAVNELFDVTLAWIVTPAGVGTLGGAV
jgi:hypothetical protein